MQCSYNAGCMFQTVNLLMTSLPLTCSSRFFKLGEFPFLVSVYDVIKQIDREYILFLVFYIAQCFCLSTSLLIFVVSMPIYTTTNMDLMSTLVQYERIIVKCVGYIKSHKNTFQS